MMLNIREILWQAGCLSMRILHSSTSQNKGALWRVLLLICHRQNNFIANFPDPSNYLCQLLLSEAAIIRQQIMHALMVQYPSSVHKIKFFKERIARLEMTFQDLLAEHKRLQALLQKE